MAVCYMLYTYAVYALYTRDVAAVVLLFDDDSIQPTNGQTDRPPCLALTLSPPFAR